MASKPSIDPLGTRSWRPAMGRVFRSRFAFRVMTTRADPARPWLGTGYVIGAACDRDQGVLVTRDHLAAFLAAHEGLLLVVDDVAEQMESIASAAPDLDVYRWVDTDRVEDVTLLERLLCTAIEGNTKPSRHLPGSLQPQLTEESSGSQIVRGRRTPSPDQLRELVDDASTLFRRHRRVRRRIRRFLAERAPDAWGYVDPARLDEQGRRWGLLTIHVQVKAAIVLLEVTARGLHLDADHRVALLAGIDEILIRERRALHGLGYIPDQGSSPRALESILKRIDREVAGGLPRTESGKIATSEEALEPYADQQPFFRSWLAYNSAHRLRTLLGKLEVRVVHPRFDVLKVTGRTSSFGQINAQNIPRDERVRSCFAARPGHVLVIADFRAIEMVALAQVCLSQFGLDSRLAATLNSGRDPHALVASLATGKAEVDLTAEERRRAKPINFGLPGLMGPAGLKAYARTAYGLELDDDQVAALTAAWFAAFPEMERFLEPEYDPGLAVATILDLTPAAYVEHTGRAWQARDPEQPSAILGGMMFKVLGSSEPTTRAGRRYDGLELDFFWARAQTLIDVLPDDLGAMVAGSRAAPRLRRALLDILDARSVLTLTGRARAGASSPARRNTVFQGLAADGAKLALWEVRSAGYAIVNFVHDELVVEVPLEPDVERHARRIGRLMIAGMRRVIPDVRIEVDCSISTHWGGAPRKSVAIPPGFAPPSPPRRPTRSGTRPPPRKHRRTPPGP